MNIDLFSRARALAPLLLVAAALAAPAAGATTVFDDTASPQDGADPILSYGPLAISFDSGTAGGTLSDVAAVLRSDSASLVGTLELKLVADNAGTPGTTLATLATLSSASISTSSFGLYDFGTLSSASLSANTTYWLEIVADGPAAVEWSWSNDLGGTGVAGQSSYSQELGVLANADGGPYQASITVSAVPEPATGLMLALGLGVLGSRSRRRAASRAASANA